MYTRYKFLWIVFLMSIGSLSQVAYAQSSSFVQVINTEVQYIFGQQITFRAELEVDTEIQETLIFFQVQGDSTNTIIGAATFDEQGVITYVHNAVERHVPILSVIEYWFRITLDNGDVFISEKFSFFYQDNRFEWQTLESPPFQVHWYEGDVTFAQFVLDTAHAGMKRSQTILEIEIPKKVEIYVYADSQDYELAKGLLGTVWLGGHVDPAQGFVVVSLPPGIAQRIQVERKIPHEIGHIMLYQAAGAGYWNLPTWLNEGFASAREFNPNPDYQLLLTQAFEQEVLMSLEELCLPFPRDASRALLSYAEATSFVRYIEQSYGAAGIRALVQAYANGNSCLNGTVVAPISKTLAQLERNWRATTFSENVFLNTITELLPWFVIGSAMLIGPSIVVLSVFSKKP